MNFIEEVLMRSKKSDKGSIVSIFFSAVFFISAWFAYMFLCVNFKMSTIIGFILPIIGYILGILFGKWLVKKLYKPRKISFVNTILYKKIKNLGYLNEFIDTINKEINDDSTIKYYDDTKGIGLLITKTWFAYIDNQYP